MPLPTAGDDIVRHDRRRWSPPIDKNQETAPQGSGLLGLKPYFRRKFNDANEGNFSASVSAGVASNILDRRDRRARRVRRRQVLLTRSQLRLRRFDQFSTFRSVKREKSLVLIVTTTSLLACAIAAICPSTYGTGRPSASSRARS